ITVIADGTESVIVNNTIIATVRNGSSLGEIDSVRVIIYNYKDWNDYVVTTRVYPQQLYIELPENVSDSYLTELLDERSIFDTTLFFIDIDDVPEGITISNRNVKIGLAYIYACKFGNHYTDFYNIGHFFYGTADCQGRLVYANGNVSITGTTTIHTDTYTDIYFITYTYNIHLKKGWNMVYIRLNYDYEEKTTEKEYTTTVPTGAEWYLQR
ncbi:MAG: hypothetical protein LBE04_08500, partial [Prevotellaceae bacterium]|nr:hypothetical protein [Prevotellaceae bacterium]